MKRFAFCMLAPALVVLPAACDQPRAQGDANAVIVAASTEIWAESEDAFREGLEPTIQTVRAERPFRLTHIDPGADDSWGQLRRFRQVVAVGSPGTPWVDDVLEVAEDSPSPPAVVRADNVWARGQQVWAMVVPEGASSEQVGQLAAEVEERLDEEYHRFVRNRMFTSGQDTVLADSLAQNVGFSLLLPDVYRYEVEDSVFRFRNDNPSPAELIREIAVTWREPIPEQLPTREELAEWRVDLTREYYVNAQDLDTTVVSYEPIEVGEASGVEFQSAWVSPPDAWPSGGPFITRAVRCPDQDRLYLMDAWVYAPDRDKYEYVIQIETILNTFRCS